MRMFKSLIAIGAISLLAVTAMAQPTGTLSIHLGGLGTSLSDGDDVSTLTALGASAPNTITLNLSDFGSSNFYYVQVTTRLRYANHDPSATLGISIVNSYINLAGTGLTIYDGWTVDEAGNDNDPRKNANSHTRGNSGTDCAANSGLVDNSARAWDNGAPGGPLAGQPAAVGKSIYTSPFTGTTSQALYSFVIIVPKQIGTFSVNFGLVFSGAPANTDPRVKTNILGNTPQGQPYQFNLSTINGSIEVVPEPASMIALGSGLVGLLALRRRRK